MFDKAASLFTIIITLFAVLTGCGAEPGVIHAQLDRNFSLGQNETAVITDEDLEITLEEVIEDSRCPEGAICIWAGRASCVVQITSGKIPPYRMVLVQPGLADQYAEDTYLTYKLAFGILPYPVVGKEIKPEEYRLQMRISK